MGTLLAAPTEPPLFAEFLLGAHSNWRISASSLLRRKDTIRNYPFGRLIW